MRNIPFQSINGSWARLIYNGCTIALDRWPGPHRSGTIIHTAGVGCFVFDHFDYRPANGPEAVYVWTAS